MKLNFKIADQHLPILKAMNKPSYEVILVVGERSTGKTTDSSGALSLGILRNIQNYIRTGQTYSTVIMRQNAGGIKGSIWRAVLNRINELKQCPEFNQYTEILETTLKGKEVGQVWAFCKGFKTSAKSDTANSKGMEKVNIYIIDEAEEISQADFDQLTMTAIRERSKVILICNTPHKDHWIVKRFLNLLPTEYEGFFDFVAKSIPNFNLVRSRLTDNPFLDEETKEIYRSCGDQNSSNYNLEKYCRDVLGLVSSNIKGKVFTNYSVCSNEEFDQIERPSRWGLDFGFSNDPLALSESKIDYNNFYTKEWVYKKRLTPNLMVVEFERLKVPKNVEIIADSSAPLLIQVLRNAGWNVIPAKKGKDSIKNGLAILQNYHIKITESSENALTEFTNYSYSLDSNKEITDVPKDEFNHYCDSLRYSISGILNKETVATRSETVTHNYSFSNNYYGEEVDNYYL